MAQGDARHHLAKLGVIFTVFPAVFCEMPLNCWYCRWIKQNKGCHWLEHSSIFIDHQWYPWKEVTANSLRYSLVCTSSAMRSPETIDFASHSAYLPSPPLLLTLSDLSTVQKPQDPSKTSQERECERRKLTFFGIKDADRQWCAYSCATSRGRYHNCRRSVSHPSTSLSNTGCNLGQYGCTQQTPTRYGFRFILVSVR